LAAKNFRNLSGAYRPGLHHEDWAFERLLLPALLYKTIANDKARRARPALAMRRSAAENGIRSRIMKSKTMTKKRVRWFRGSNAEACEHVHMNPSIHNNDFLISFTETL